MAESDEFEAVRKRISWCLDATGLSYVVDPERDFLVTVGSMNDSPVWCVPQKVEATGGNAVLVFSITNVGVNIDDELKCFLTAVNDREFFGKFILHAQSPDVIYIHALLGDFLNSIELKTSILAVAKSAHLHAEEIKRRWGGSLYGEQGS